MVTTDVFSLLNQQASTLTLMRADVNQNLQQGSDANSRNLGISTGIDHLQNQMRQLMPSPSLEQIDQLISTRFSKLSQDQSCQMQARDFRNEQQFQHLERVISAITSSSPFQPLGADRQVETEAAGVAHSYHTTPARRGARGASMSDISCTCHCRCHFSKRPRLFIWKLSAFRSTLGSFALFFTNTARFRCDVASCTSYGKRYQITYTFPSWLFHAAISMTLTDYHSTPELILRVLNRIPASTFRTGVLAM